MSASSINDREKIFIRRRLEAVAGLIAVGFLLLAIRAVDLHWLQADRLQLIFRLPLKPSEVLFLTWQVQLPTS